MQLLRLKLVQVFHIAEVILHWGHLLLDQWTSWHRKIHFIFAVLFCAYAGMKGFRLQRNVKLNHISQSKTYA